MASPGDARVVNNSGALPQLTASLSQLDMSQTPEPDGSSPRGEAAPEVSIDNQKPLWTQAYILLSEKEESLVQKFESICLNRQNPAGMFSAASTTASLTFSKMGPDEQHDQMKKIVEEGKVKHTGSGKTATSLKVLDKGAKIITWATPFIEKALSSSREASLAWVAVGLILPFISNLAAASEENQKGFVYVTSRLEYYTALEPEMRRSQGGISPALVKAAEAEIRELYRAVLEFQVRTVVRLYEKRLKGLFKDTIKLDDWASLKAAVEKHEELVSRQFSQVNGLVLSMTVKDMLEESKQHVERLHVDLSSIQEKLDCLLHYKIDKQEEELLHLFLPNNSVDGSNTGYKFFMEQKGERTEGTCEWFLTHDVFQGWLSQKSPILLCSADPGCGKSVLSRYLVEEYLPKIQAASICYFFFEEHNQNRATQALCALIHQLLCQVPELIRKVPAIKRAKRNNGKNLATDLETLWSILLECLLHPDTAPIIIVMDALDECNQNDRDYLIRKLRSLVESRGQQPHLLHTKFLLTCRPYQSIISQFGKMNDFESLVHADGVRESAAISREVDLVISAKIAMLTLSSNVSTNNKLCGLLKTKMLGVPDKNRTYLWIYLTFERIQKEPWKKSQSGLAEFIKVLPDDLNKVYEKMLAQSSANNRDEVQRALSVVLAAERPLSVAEMNVALNQHGNTKGLHDFVADLESDEDFEARIREICGLFISTHDGYFHFLHQTARTFLLEKTRPGLEDDQDSPSKQGRWQGSITLGYTHAVLARICIDHLLLWDPVWHLFYTGAKSDDVHTGHVSSDQTIARGWVEGKDVWDFLTTNFTRATYFHDYCDANWPHHVKQSTEAVDPDLFQQCVRLCNNKYYLKREDIYTSVGENVGMHTGSGLGGKSYLNEVHRVPARVRRHVNPLTFAAFYNLTQVFAAIIENYRAKLASSPDPEVFEDLRDTYDMAGIDLLRYLSLKGGESGGWPQYVFSGVFDDDVTNSSAALKLHVALDGGADVDYDHEYGGRSRRQMWIRRRYWSCLAIFDFREKLGLRTNDWERHEDCFQELQKSSWRKENNYEDYQRFFLEVQRKIMLAEGRAPLEAYDSIVVSTDL